jgi:uncharacterized protein YegL
MKGDKIRQLNKGLIQIQNELQQDSIASRRVEIGIVTFGPVKNVMDFTSAEYFYPPQISAGCNAPMGEAIKTSISILRRRKDHYKAAGISYYRPYIIMITDGQPNDDWSNAVSLIQRGEESNEFVFFAVGVEGADMDTLAKISVRKPLKLRGLAFGELFQWLSNSLGQGSKGDPAATKRLPPAAWAHQRVDRDRLPSGTSELKIDTENELDATAFAPPSVPRGERFLIQCWLHNPADRSMVEREAELADPSTLPRASAPLGLRRELGRQIELRVEGNGLRIVDPIQIVEYVGRMTPVYFPAKMPSLSFRSKFHVTIRFFQQGLPIGRTTFELVHGKLRSAEPVKFKHYRHAFFSYCSSDRPRVLEIAQAYLRIGTAVFQDVLSFEPGDRWNHKLFKHIDEADLFMLFWSKAAKESEWVIKEAEYALKQLKRRHGRAPDIIPYILEGPPVPTPPNSLRDIHFNDPIRAINTAEQRGRDSAGDSVG